VAKKNKKSKVVKIGVVDTMFARYNMGAAAIAELSTADKSGLLLERGVGTQIITTSLSVIKLISLVALYLPEFIANSILELLISSK
jgi:hypothetical protein